MIHQQVDKCLFIRRSFRGVLLRSLSFFLLMASAGLLLSAPGISSEQPSVATPSELHGSSTSSFTLSSRTDLDEIVEEIVEGEQLLGRDLAVSRPGGEEFINGMRSRLVGEVASSLDKNAFIDYMNSRLRNQVVTDKNVNELSFSDWLTTRRETLRLGLLQSAADYVSGYVLQAAETGALSHSFVHKIDIDYRTEIGTRRWEAGLSALGSLREKEDDAIVWQLRGFTSGGSSGGANAGIIYRRVVNDAALLGFNVFLDYESHGDYDESFWRWSYGGELRSAWLDAYLNHYVPITDAQIQTIGTNRYAVYSRGGYDAALELHAPSRPWLSGGLTYYHFDGEFGQKDDKGLRYGLKFNPTTGSRFLGGQLEVLIELDDKSGGGSDVGGQISYKYEFNKGTDGGYLSGEAFDPRAYFYEQVRREYSQRISRVLLNSPVGILATLGGFAADNSESAVFTGLNGATQVAATITTGSYPFTAGNRLSVRTGANTTVNANASNWTLTMYSSSTVRFPSSGVLDLLGGTVRLVRSGGITAIETAGTTVNLLGTDLEVRNGGTNSNRLALFEGSIAYTVASGTTLRSSVVGGLANVTQDGVLRLVGCEEPSQRSPLGASYGETACANDNKAVLSVSANTTVQIISQSQTVMVYGDAATLTAVAGRTMTTRWARATNPYRFDILAAASVIAGNAMILLEVNGVATPRTLALGAGQNLDCDSSRCRGIGVGLVYTSDSVQSAASESRIGNIATVSALQTSLSVNFSTNERIGTVPAAMSTALAGVSYSLLGVNPSANAANFAVNSGGIVQIVRALPGALTATLSIVARPPATSSAVLAATLQLQVTIYPALSFANNLVTTDIASAIGAVHSVTATGGGDTKQYTLVAAVANVALSSNGAVSLSQALAVNTSLTVRIRATDNLGSLAQTLTLILTNPTSVPGAILNLLAGGSHYRSTDGGVTWGSIQDTVNGHDNVSTQTRVGVESLGNNLYLVNSAGTYTYTSNGSWSRLGNNVRGGGSLDFGGLVTHRGSIYSLGSQNTTGNVYRLSVTTWERLAGAFAPTGTDRLREVSALSTGRTSGGTVYVFDGITGVTSPPTFSRTIWSSTNLTTWVSVGVLPTALNSADADSGNMEVLYFKGNVYILHDNGNVYRAAESNMAASAWTDIGDLPYSTAGTGHMAAVAQAGGVERIYLVGGTSNSDVWVSSDGITWTKLGAKPANSTSSSGNLIQSPQ